MVSGSLYSSQNSKIDSFRLRIYDMNIDPVLPVCTLLNLLALIYPLVYVSIAWKDTNQFFLQNFVTYRAFYTVHGLVTLSSLVLYLILFLLDRRASIDLNKIRLISTCFVYLILMKTYLRLHFDHTLYNLLVGESYRSWEDKPASFVQKFERIAPKLSCCLNSKFDADPVAESQCDTALGNLIVENLCINNFAKILYPHNCIAVGIVGLNLLLMICHVSLKKLGLRNVFETDN